jgi:hypothetical protein
MEGSLVAYKVFTNGSVLNASEINDNLMNQSVMVFSNSAARSAAITSPVEGMVTYLEDSDRFETYVTSWIPILSAGSAIAFTPTWLNLTVGNGVYNRSHYTIAGKTVTVAIDFTLGSTSAITGSLGLTMPAELTFAVAAKTGVSDLLLLDTSATRRYLGISRFLSTNDFNLRAATVIGTFIDAGQTINATNPFTWTTGDVIQFGAVYEVA